MFRIIVILVVFLACIYIGFYFGEVFKHRSVELKDFQKALMLAWPF